MASATNAKPIELNFFDQIAEECYRKYASLPKSGKPNSSEWTLMSAVVQSTGSVFKVVSLGTGSKCVGRNEMCRTGDVLNDSHAEVIARRGFLRYLYHKVAEMKETGVSDVFQKIHEEKCVFKEEVSYHFFTSHTPCGDASIFPKTSLDSSPFEDECFEIPEAKDFCISRQLSNHVGADSSKHFVLKDIDVPESCQNETLNRKRSWSEEEESACDKRCKLTNDQKSMTGVVEKRRCGEDQERDDVKSEDIHRTGAKCVPTAVQDLRTPGVDYHVLGVLRTKPGRGDPTLSLSCSDKLARWNVMGCQGALLSLLISTPVVFQSVVVGGGCPFSYAALHRSLVDRVRALQPAEPVIVQSSLPFSDRRTLDTSRRLCASSIVWCDVSDRPMEVSAKGRKQGVTKKTLERSSSRLKICRKELGLQFVAVSDLSGLADCTYRQAKELAKDYNLRWLRAKETCFKSWPSKPAGLMEFKICH